MPYYAEHPQRVCMCVPVSDLRSLAPTPVCSLIVWSPEIWTMCLFSNSGAYKLPNLQRKHNGAKNLDLSYGCVQPHCLPFVYLAVSCILASLIWVVSYTFCF